MRKLLFLIVMSLISTQTFAVRPATTAKHGNMCTKAPEAGIYFGGWGTIGDTRAEIEMNGMTGTFEYNGIKRKLRFESYNKRTSVLILKEYDLKGKYIGKFVGEYNEFYVPEKGMTCMSYTGTFTNTKGHKTSFMLYYD